MSINRQDSRHRIKRSNLTGVTPTAHTASTDFTDGTWLNTDIREGEFFYNIPDVRLWVGTGTSSREIEFVGGTAGGESLADTLVVGNTTGANDIIVDVDRQIKTTDTGFIQFGDTGAEPNTIIISNGGDGVTTNANNMGFSGTDPYITLQAIDIASTITDMISLSPQGIGNGTGIKSTDTTTGVSSEIIITPTEVSNNCTDGSTYQTGVYSSSLIIPNTEIIAQDLGGTSSRVVVRADGSILQESTDGIITSTIDINPTSISLYADAGNSGTGLSLGPNFIGIGFDAITDPSADLTTIQISDGGRSISFTSNPSTNNPEIYIAGNSLLVSSGDYITLQTTELKSNLSNVIRTEIGATISTSSVGTQSISSITSMLDNQMISIDGRISGYCSSPNRAYSVKFYAVFEKYGGTIYQVGTTDLTVKENYGDGTTVDISTDGTDILINVVPNNTLTINWNSIYEYIITP